MGARCRLLLGYAVGTRTPIARRRESATASSAAFSASAFATFAAGDEVHRARGGGRVRIPAGLSPDHFDVFHRSAAAGNVVFYLDDEDENTDSQVPTFPM